MFYCGGVTRRIISESPGVTVDKSLPYPSSNSSSLSQRAAAQTKGAAAWSTVLEIPEGRRLFLCAAGSDAPSPQP